LLQIYVKTRLIIEYAIEANIANRSSAGD